MPDYPQYVVLGFFPKQLIKRDYIKVKPKGFWFHDAYFKNIQILIDFFKKNFQDKGFQSYQKRQKSPRARQPEMPKPQADVAESWADVKNWGGDGRSEHNQGGGGSVHSAGGEDNAFGGRPSWGASSGRGKAPGAAAASGGNVCFNC